MGNETIKNLDTSEEFANWANEVVTLMYNMGEEIDKEANLQVLKYLFASKDTPEKAASELAKVMARLRAINGDWKMNYFDKMLKYAGKYSISIQFWGEGNTNVFIEKDGVHLTDFGGLNPGEAINKTLEYLDRINGKS